MVYKIITSICLVGMICELIFVLTSIILKNRKDRISFIRSFKKGKCAIIFIFAYPLLVMASHFNGQTIPVSIFKGFENTIGLVVLKYDFSLVGNLMAYDSLFNFTIYFTYTLVALNAVMFTLSLTNQAIWHFIQGVKGRFSKRERLYLLGMNEENISIYKSDKDRVKTIVSNLNKDECYKLYLDKILYSCEKDYSSLVEKIIKNADDRKNILIINTLDDEENISICKAVVENVIKLPDDKKKSIFLNLNVFVFGDPKYQTIYDDIVESCYGCIHYINKYQEIAIDFINKYPLTLFMNENQIDYSSSVIKDNTEINVCMLGFGKTNRQIFLTSVANNQFIKEENGEIALKKVNYHIFDKNEAENNKNLNHNYYRFRNEFSDVDKNDYLPLPSEPAYETYYHLDINDGDFYNTIKNISTNNPKDANFVIIAFGSDLENMDMAQKLVEKKNEWGINNLVFFVKMRHWNKNQTLIKEKDCYFIGNEDEIVYNIDNIVGGTIYSMAKMRNETYDLEYDICHSKNLVLTEDYILNNRKKANENWYKTKSQLERESSIYCCLSLRSKLNLMGLDYAKAEDERRGLTEKEYYNIYASDDLPDTKTYNKVVNGKNIVYYSLSFKDSRRKNMAIHEHFRWNSFMISKGVVPADKNKIEKETTITKDGKKKFTNGRNYTVRRHGNLTTFEGLVEFRKIIAERDMTGEENTDVIKYDYQLLDDAYWLLKGNGYKIVKR